MIARQDMHVDAASLTGAINNLGSEFVRLRSELQDAQCEILRLRRRLAKAQPSTVPGLELSSLRRQVAYHCHPDRGGSHQLMSDLNTLFDLLEGRRHAG